VTWIDDVVRVAAAGAAFATFYVAWFVYEDEEKKLQNKIEAWWVQFDDFRSHLVSRQAAFLVVVALRSNEVFDRLFGPKLLSKYAIAEATSLTLGSVFVAHAVSAIWLGGAGPADAAFGGAMFAFAFAPLASPRLRWLPYVPMLMFVAFVVFMTLSSLLMFGMSLAGRYKMFSSLQAPEATLNVLWVAVSVGIAVTLFQVAVARRAMRSTVAARSEWPIVGGMVVVALPLGIAVALILAIAWSFIASGINPLEHPTPLFVLAVVIFGIGLGCAVATALCGLVAAVAGIMLLHRLAWPLASRILYALGRYRLVQNKAVLNGAGAALAGVAITGSYGWQAILKYFGVA
jgi:hypothetical protein